MNYFAASFEKYDPKEFKIKLSHLTLLAFIGRKFVNCSSMAWLSEWLRLECIGADKRGKENFLWNK
ncbi:MAG: hypothetical protein A4E71_01480 [Smithella sp. PtaU1.Bin162]|nr:MAG: hypothetical protein A4E71_01480 [Smithella sp. PtaU1.Bin162]